VVNIIGSASRWLEQFPWLWQFILKLYGARSFKPHRVYYKKKCAAYESETCLPSDFEIIFDAQCLQNSTRQRGIGKYSLSLIASMCRAAPNKRFAAYLTNIAPQLDLDKATRLLKSLQCPNLQIFVLSPFKSSNRIRLDQAQIILGELLGNLNPKSIISLSNFEKPSASIPLPLNSTYKTCAILYDLIPLQYSHQLLISNRQKTTYQWLLNNMQKFDFLLSISQTTNDVWVNLTSESTSVRVIGGAGNASTRDLVYDFSARSGILCVGAEQKHKNVEKLISAYGVLPLNLRTLHPLTIVGIRSRGVRISLTKFARRIDCDIDMPQYLSDEKLKMLYRSNRLLVMPSLSEGLSLPILEAWDHGLPVIGSVGTVAEELIQEKSLLFDPKDIHSIVNTIQLFLENEKEWGNAMRKSNEMAKNYSWTKTANLALNAHSEFLNNE
jgi:glycosyltransferase involved in cell wall biosynthesis